MQGKNLHSILKFLYNILKLRLNKKVLKTMIISQSFSQTQRSEK